MLDIVGCHVIRQDKKTGSTEFTHDGMDVLQDRSSDGTITNYVNGLGIDDNLKQTTGSTSRYFLTDHLGSTVGMSDSSGNIAESAIYDSFGNKLTSNLTTRYQYTGRECDEYTGLMFYRARFYDQQLGRFISEDPIMFEGGLDFYLYVENNPIRNKDPYGLAPWDYVLFLYYAHYCLEEGLACKGNIQREFDSDPCKWAENHPNYSSPMEQSCQECFLVNPNCQNMWYYGTKAGVTDWPIGKGPLGGINSIKDGRPSVDPIVKP